VDELHTALQLMGVRMPDNNMVATSQLLREMDQSGANVVTEPEFIQYFRDMDRDTLQKKILMYSGKSMTPGARALAPKSGSLSATPCIVTIVEFTYWFVGMHSKQRGQTPGKRKRLDASVPFESRQAPPCGCRVSIFQPGPKQRTNLHAFLFDWRRERWEWIEFMRNKNSKKL